jgi:hypothetical protein
MTEHIFFGAQYVNLVLDTASANWYIFTNESADVIVLSTIELNLNLHRPSCATYAIIVRQEFVNRGKNGVANFANACI